MDHPNFALNFGALSHPNPKVKTFLVRSTALEGPCKRIDPISDLAWGLRSFRTIVTVVAHAHAQEHASIYHLDLKPETIISQNTYLFFGLLLHLHRRRL